MEEDIHGLCNAYAVYTFDEAEDDERCATAAGGRGQLGHKQLRERAHLSTM